MKKVQLFIVICLLITLNIINGEDIEEDKMKNCKPYGTCLPCTKKEMVYVYSIFIIYVIFNLYY